MLGEGKGRSLGQKGNLSPGKRFRTVLTTSQVSLQERLGPPLTGNVLLYSLSSMSEPQRWTGGH